MQQLINSFFQRWFQSAYKQTTDSNGQIKAGTLIYEFGVRPYQNKH